MSKAKPVHKRILLKLSGEALMGDDAFGINRATIERIVGEIGEVTAIDAGGDLATVQLPGGGVLQVRGKAEVGKNVFVRNGVIEGEAPSLPLVLIEI